MPATVGVVVVHDDPRVAEGVAETLERAQDLFVAATSLDAARAGNVVLAGGERLVALQPLAHPIVALADGDEIRAARAALAAGAREIVRWPGEAGRLAGAIRRAVASAVPPAGGRAIAVAGARGGAGATTVVAGLAAAIPGALAVDLDTTGAGLRAFAAGEPARTLGSLVLADCAPESLAASLVVFTGSSRMLHAAPYSAPVSDAEANGLMRAARAIAPVIVVDCARGDTAGSWAAFAAADVRLIVAADDVASVRGARSLLGRADARVVLRRARRGGVAVRDVATSLGSDLIAVVPADPALARAADLGAWPARASRGVRALRALAVRVNGE